MKKHFCPDWDYMAIDETCPEFEGCTCTISLPTREDEEAKITEQK